MDLRYVASGFFLSRNTSNQAHAHTQYTHALLYQIILLCMSYNIYYVWPGETTQDAKREYIFSILLKNCAL